MVPLTLSSAPIWDNLIGCILVFCFIFGVPGNLVALKNFYSRKKDPPTLLYISISCVDSWTCLAHLPTTISLFGGRAPILFNSLAACTGWTVVFRFLQKVSIYLVMLLSVYRTLVIVSPFRKVAGSYLLASLGMYTVFLIVVDTFSAKWDSFKFVSIGPFCVDYPLATASTTYGTLVTTFKTLTTIELGLPAVITFFSFIICAIKLSHTSANAFQAVRNKQASVTVAIFTALFLVCNLPFFSLMVLNTTARVMGYTWPKPFFSSVFMSYYSWLISKIVLTVVNAAANPVLYYCRMSNFQIWAKSDADSSKFHTVERTDRERDENRGIGLSGSVLPGNSRQSPLRRLRSCDKLRRQAKSYSLAPGISKPSLKVRDEIHPG
jgi:hypothetical protein